VFEKLHISQHMEIAERNGQSSRAVDEHEDELIASLAPTADDMHYDLLKAGTQVPVGIALSTHSPAPPAGAAEPIT
jgi:hypothetical protein